MRLHAGALHAELRGLDVAAVRHEGEEVMRRIGVRVRPPGWGTVAPQIGPVEVRHENGRAIARLSAMHRGNDIAFAWSGSVELSACSLAYEIDGECRRAFDYARIGIVLLHPPATTAGRRFRARRGGQEVAAGHLPELVGPQLIVDGQVQPLFPAFDELDVDLSDGRHLHLELDGDLFEMEDQRNWTDASLKTYSTPLALPLPHRAHAGQRLRQRIRLEVSTAPGRVLSRRRVSPEDSLAVSIGAQAGGTVPEVGTGVSSGALATTARAVRPAHLHLLVEDAEALVAAGALARTAGAALQLELCIPASDAAAAVWIEAVARRLADEASPVARVLLARTGEDATRAGTARLAREWLPSVALLGGSPTNFAELNRNPPPPDAPLDGLYYAVNPQVHDSDDCLVMQNAWAQRDTILTARALPGKRPVHVAPVTWQPRGVAERDEREHSLLAAAWLTASAAALLPAGAASVTWFALPTLGEGERWPPALYVLAELCAWRGQQRCAVHSAAPEDVAALGAVTTDGVHVLVANLSPRERRVTLEGAAGLLASRLHLTTGWGAAERTGSQLQLGPYEVVRLFG